MSTSPAHAPGTRLRRLAAAARGALVREADVLLFLLVLPIVAVALVNPYGDFPLNDDWAFGLTAKHLAETGELRLSSWAAMTLVWQAAYGGLVCAITGFSFTALRFTTIAVALALNLVLFALFRRATKSRGLSIAATLTVFFNPLEFNLTFTFMTEVHFQLWTTCALYCVVRAYEAAERRVRWLLAAGLFAALSYLIRQFALLLPAALVGSQFLLWFAGARSRRGLLKESAAIVLLPLVAFALFTWWQKSGDGPSGEYLKRWDYLKQLQWREIAAYLWGSLSYLAWFAAPLLLVFTMEHYRAATVRRRLVAVLAAVVVILLFVVWRSPIPGKGDAFSPITTPYRETMPYLSNIFYNVGLGPITFYEHYFHGVPPNTAPAAVWTALTGWVWLCFLALLLAARRVGVSGLLSRPAPAFLALLAGALMIVQTVFASGYLFDRYILTLLVPALWLLVAYLGERGVTLRAGPAIAVGLCLAAMGAFAVAGTHDYLAWNRAKWAALRYAMNELRAHPSEISGGIEFNGWYLSQTFKPQGNDYRYLPNTWWVVSEKYRIFWTLETARRHGFEPMREFLYTSWVGGGERRSMVLARKK